MISTLSDLIAQVESSGNPWAVRYEPLHRPNAAFVSRMVDAAKCSIDTARVLCSMSWGLYQIMGDELMALGLSMSPLSYCGSVQTQNDMFAKFLIEKKLGNYSLGDIVNSASARTFFAAKYNGPGNVATYSQCLLDVYAKSVTANTTSA